MSLFSGMKLADSDTGTTEKSGTTEAKLKNNKTLASTEAEKTSEMPEPDDSSPFSFILGTSDVTDTSDSTATSEDACKMDNTGIPFDKQLRRADIVPRFSNSPDISLGDDLNFDLDPIKVTGDVKTTSGKHQPAGFDLQDLDFSRPFDLDSETLTETAVKRDGQAVKSESSFSFITKESPMLSSDESAIPVDNWTLLDEKPLQSQEVTTLERGDDNDASFDASVSQRLQVYKDEYAKQLHVIKNSTSDLVNQVCQFSKHYVASGRCLVQKQQHLHELQQQQQHAVDVEDYEKAEELHLQCRALENKISNADSPLPCYHPALRSLLTELQSLSDQERAERRHMAHNYQELITEQRQAVADSRQRSLQQESGHLHKIQEERSILNRDLGHFRLDKEHLHQREIHLADRIDEGTGKLRQTRDSLIADRKQVQEEIKDLKAKLAALHLQETAISESVIEKDQEIEAVTRDFDNERSTVEERGVLERVEAELRLRGEGLDEEEHKLADRMKEDYEMEASETRLLADLEENLVREEVALTDLTNRDSLTKLWPEENVATLSESRENLLKKKDAARRKREEVQNATSNLLQSQTRVVILRQKVSDTEGHIAALTETKQLAVSGRNFSEAKRLTDEIKKLTTDGQRIQEEMEELSKWNDERSKTVTMLREDVERLQEEVDEKERGAELSTKAKLLDRIIALREQLQATSEAPLVQMLQRSELVSSSLQVKFLCLKHQLPLPAELEDFTEDSSIDCNRTGECLEVTREEDKSVLDFSRDGSC